MYVRWKKRAMTSYRRRNGQTALTAVLVESQRVDGKPRQRTISYLGTITQELVINPFRQTSFWASAERRLAQQGLDDATRARLEASLLRVVPRPLAEDWQRERAHLQALTESIRRA